MKNTFLLLALVAILISSCVNKHSKNTDTHVHEDGTEHVNHDNSSEKMPQQESFEVITDSLSNGNDTIKKTLKKEHSHGHGHTHTH